MCRHRAANKENMEIIMKRLVIGILAHVDSGKTTLSEGLLYLSGQIKKPGRVDHGNAFLDTESIERERGITIFSKQAIIETDRTYISLLDTPGHIDFSAEAERTLQVLDYAILVISASDGIRPHTETLWKLLRRHGIPVFIFINKMDLPDTNQDELLSELREKFGDGCVNFNADTKSYDFAESAAMCSEELLDEFLESGTVSDASLTAAISQRRIFPCLFGSALKLSGISELLAALEAYTIEPSRTPEFGAKVFKISEDEKGKRLTYMKITGGSLNVKDVLDINLSEKANEIRIYSGLKYKNVQKAPAGTVCAVTGLTGTYPGQGFGAEQDSEPLTLEPVFTYTVKLPPGFDEHTAITNLRQLEEEETQLHVVKDSRLNRINIQLMGEVQLEIVKRIASERFGMDIELEKSGVIYKETIKNRVEGFGHYEPLRHYAEVHLLLEPLDRGSGLKFAAKCSEDDLDRNFQRLVLTHLEEKEHIGVLTGSPITDMKITLISGKAHLKHTEGGDFRQATYRALRQGLMQAESILLEPWYKFTIELPTDSVGRAMTDINRMGGRFTSPETFGNTSIIRGNAPVSAMSDYNPELIAYTKGKGRMSLEVSGYEPCSDPQKVIDEIGYSAEADVENTADSVFCSHGAGYTVKWDEVFSHMHLPAAQLETPVVRQSEPPVRQNHVGFSDDEELLKIFEKTYGKVRRRAHHALNTPKNDSSPVRTGTRRKPKDGNYVLVDGYNIIFAWDSLKKLAEDDLDLARTTLANRLCAYCAMRKAEVILVFDAYKVKGNHGSIEKVGNITVVYTKEAETADSYIEKATHKLGKNYNVKVATSDYMEQLIILGNGAYRVSAREFLGEVEAAEAELREYLSES